MLFRISDPHSDPIPRDIIEKAPLECSATAVVLLLIIARKTIGFQKRADRISLTQFQKRTGYSRDTIITGLKELKDKRWIEFIRSRAGNVYIIGLQPQVVRYYDYQLFSSRKFRLAWSKISTIERKKVVEKLDIQETLFKKETIKETTKEEIIFSTDQEESLTNRSGNGHSKSLYDFLRFERMATSSHTGKFDKNRAVNLQIQSGSIPAMDLLDYWEERGYTELLERYNGGK